MENSSEFWSNVSVVVVSPVAIGAGLAKGVYDASTNNGAFADGFSEAATPVIRAGKNFGAEHGPVITSSRSPLTAAQIGVGFGRPSLVNVVSRMYCVLARSANVGVTVPTYLVDILSGQLR